MLTSSRYLLRRAAARAASSQPSGFVSAQRSFVTRTPFSSRVQAQWQPSAFQRRFATDDASPTDATTTGETIPSEAEQSHESPEEVEPSAEELKQDITEESVATSEAADAAGEQSFTEKAKDAISSVTEPAARLAAAAAASSPFESTRRSNFRDTSEQPQPSKIVYVGNLYFEVKAEQLERQFNPYGEVVNSKIVTDNNGLSKGYVRWKFWRR